MIRLAFCAALLTVPAQAETLLTVGDSITQGIGSKGHSIGEYAVQILAKEGKHFALINDGFSGKPAGYFISIGAKDLAALHPEFVTIQCGSANGDWSSEASTRKAFETAMALTQEARKGGSHPILLTATPSFYGQGAGQAGWEANRRLSNSLVRSQGLPVLDLDMIWGTGSNPNALKPEYDSGDHTHPNDAGYLAAAEKFVTIIELLDHTHIVGHGRTFHFSHTVSSRGRM